MSQMLFIVYKFALILITRSARLYYRLCEAIVDLIAIARKQSDPVKVYGRLFSRLQAVVYLFLKF